MIDPKAEKAEARREAFARRKRAQEAAPGASAAACGHLLRFIEERPARVVSGYMAIRSELDPLAAMVALAERGCALCLPVIDGPGLPLRFREWRPGAALVEGPFGVRIPEEGAWLEPELLITPLVAFDDRRYRLGYGGGYYDRTLARRRARGPVFAVGFAYAAQRVEHLPVEPSDQPLDAIVTEAGILA